MASLLLDCLVFKPVGNGVAPFGVQLLAKKYSLGMKQRLGLAGALLGRPPILISMFSFLPIAILVFVLVLTIAVTQFGKKEMMSGIESSMILWWIRNNLQL